MTFTKISGAILAAFLIIMGLKEISHLVYHPHELEEPAYPIEVPENLGAAGAEEEAPLNLGLLLANADVAAGEQAVRKCAACHTFEEGGGTLTGPNLYGIVGAAKAHVASFAYSSALSEAEGNWTYEDLNGFIENPRGYLPGTAMSFAGIRDDEERVNVIAYLASITPDAPPFPEPLPEEEEAAGGEEVAAAEGEAAEGEEDAADEGAEPAAEAEDASPDPTLESSEEIAEETGEAADAAEAGEAAAGGDAAQPAEDSAGGEAGTAQSPTQQQETSEAAEDSEAAAEDEPAQPE